MKKLIIAGGCFWGVEHYYKRLKGTLVTEVGYTDGVKVNPTYQEVCASSGHVEAVYLEYDETVLPLEKVVEHFFRIVDPTQYNRQGHDLGVQYRNGFYYFDEADKSVIEAWIAKEQQKHHKKVVTYVKKAMPFYNAEEYHQDYLDKVPNGYCHINMHLAKPEELK
ncbi:MAG: peptide-methionine (S)-S-oxide reductase MsrA [Candidatus Izemoplasmatales bacterium]